MTDKEDSFKWMMDTLNGVAFVRLNTFDYQTGGARTGRFNVQHPNMTQEPRPPGPMLAAIVEEKDETVYVITDLPDTKHHRG